jgi:hypothetical protein
MAVARDLSGNRPDNANATDPHIKTPVEREILVNDSNVAVDFTADTYQTVAASTTQTCGTGAIGDILDGVLIIPGTTAAGIVQIKDGAGTAITIFQGGGTTALSSLIPFFVPLGIQSAAGGWSIITNANETAIAVGKFTV